ncbi:MAG: DNA-protecting protein DprA [Phyllobacteriaceae bacterium]|nr:DNA-protecting protein DprA [Phyllobacteriaceae bacterium]
MNHSPAHDAAPQHLSDSQRFYWLRLIRTERVGPVTFRQLVAKFGSAQLALEALPEISARSGRLIKPAPEDVIRREIELAHALGAQFIALGEPDYPPLLRHLDNAPPLIAVLGDAAALACPALAIVGSRNASANGARFARTLATGIAADGFPIASGLARGIDRAAHEGAFDGGGTIAVLAGGLDRPYPPQNLDLLARIVDTQGSCAITVMPFGHEPQARDFPRRNAIIAGLALGVVVVEASERSGSLITATMATEAGRMVFAVPGHPLDPRSSGTNGLIREGAELVRSADDVLDVIRPMKTLPSLVPVRAARPMPPQNAMAKRDRQPGPP